MASKHDVTMIKCVNILSHILKVTLKRFTSMYLIFIGCLLSPFYSLSFLSSVLNDTAAVAFAADSIVLLCC